MVSKPIFVDSNVFIALYNPFDTLHDQALHIGQVLDRPTTTLIVSNYIFLEVVTVLSQRRGKMVSNSVGDMLLNHPNVQIIQVDEFSHRATWNIFQKLSNKNVSFVDCSTAVLMHNEGIHTLLTFDKKDFKSFQKTYRFRLVSSLD